jgi:ribosome biogenesis GTPase
VNEPGLEELGWGPFFAEAWEPFAARDLVPARVVVTHVRDVRVRTATAERLAGLAGRLRLASRAPEERPAVGDWVALRPREGTGRTLVDAVLPRRTAFVRRAAGDHTVQQVLAANVDTVFLVMGLDRDYNPRRIERALVLAWESGAEPVIVLNKADLCDDVEGRRAEVQSAAPGVPVCTLAAKRSEGLETLVPWLRRGRTVALLGSSGVGKSTIVNRLLGEERFRTREVRESDQRGRHTTTHRELVTIPGGGLLVDTPGLREIQLWATEEGLATAFEDIERLSARCRFRDCAHEAEPNCAVRSAVEEGTLAPERLASFHKLRAELRSLEIREDPERLRAERARWRTMVQSVRKLHPKRSR